MRRKIRQKIVPKNCPFCKENTLPSYREVDALARFVTDRGKIIPASRSGICAKHQRKIASHVKYARHLALLPFILRPY